MIPTITNTDYWIKIVEMLQQNWAVIEKNGGSPSYTVFFFNDLGGIFDQIVFCSYEDAAKSLRKNGFSLFSENKEAQKFIHNPKHPSYEREHPNGKIYSSGRFWK